MLTNLTLQAAADGGITVLALALDAEMARDSEARARYLATWGTEWVPFTVECARFGNVDSDATRAGTVR